MNHNCYCAKSYPYSSMVLHAKRYSANIEILKYIVPYLSSSPHSLIPFFFFFFSLSFHTYFPVGFYRITLLDPLFPQSMVDYRKGF